MPELYIIGNGFDKGHGLKTSYQNFREYLGQRLTYHISKQYSYIAQKKQYGIHTIMRQYERAVTINWRNERRNLYERCKRIL